MFAPGTPVAVFSTWVVRGLAGPAIAVICTTSSRFSIDLLKSKEVTVDHNIINVTIPFENWKKVTGFGMVCC